jgi:drug/metabolite transporter (DMT)-like permease
LAQKSKNLKSSLLLLLAAIIWGFAFVAQRAGMAWVGPFTFNGIRFLLGTLTLLPLVFISCRKIAIIYKDQFFSKRKFPTITILILKIILI